MELGKSRRIHLQYYQQINHQSNQVHISSYQASQNTLGEKDKLEDIFEKMGQQLYYLNSSLQFGNLLILGQKIYQVMCILTHNFYPNSRYFYSNQVLQGSLPNIAMMYYLRNVSSQSIQIHIPFGIQNSQQDNTSHKFD